MGIKGNVKRNFDGHYVHANCDTGGYQASHTRRTGGAELVAALPHGQQRVVPATCFQCWLRATGYGFSILFR